MRTQERIASLDVIRGFAIFGIFFVNWPTMVGVETLEQERGYIGLDAYTRCFYDLFIQTKFYTIFSILFGLSFTIFMKKAKEKGNDAPLVYIRRLVALFIFGALHYILFWSGDILHSYALFGLVLLLYIHRSTKTILVTAITMQCLFILFTMLTLFIPLENTMVTAMPIPSFQWLYVSTRFYKFFGENMTSNLVYLPEIAGLFLIGLYIGKKDVLRRVSHYKRPLQIIQMVALLCTLPSWYYILSYFNNHTIYYSATVYPFVSFSGKTLCLFYIITLLRLMEHKAWQRLLHPFQFVGRMALSNYIGQTLVTQFLFSGFFSSRTLPLSIGVPYCFLVFILQVFFSKWWLSHFSYGPLEYIWRWGTYGRKKQPSLI
ncbi:DUF418 domain-containing protein [Ectobacillus sp. sgz5001026]|uniref:DUF418 domain-containing protein n=1 Tax=Ectobacillus sp. sgz5001026 TaxID=3242473 RepID=UPI0036D37653